MTSKLDQSTAVHCLALIQNQTTELLVALAQNGKLSRVQLIALARMGQTVAELQAACDVTPV